MQDKFTFYIMCLGIALLGITQAFPINSKKTKMTIVDATIVVKPNMAKVVLPEDTSKPYTSRQGNSKFKVVLNYIKNHKDTIVPEIQGFSEARKERLFCLALNIYHEARGSTEEDKMGVAYVTINRAQSEGYPSNICNVVWQQTRVASGNLVGQFSWTVYDIDRLLPKEREAWLAAQNVALEVYKQTYSAKYEDLDITDGAKHYYAPKLIKAPKWARVNIESKKQIGDHMYIKIASK